MSILTGVVALFLFFGHFCLYKRPAPEPTIDLGDNGTGPQLHIPPGYGAAEDDSNRGGKPVGQNDIQIELPQY